jgi:protocatechuate 3,4-dioxygenase beta subunit
MKSHRLLGEYMLFLDQRRHHDDDDHDDHGGLHRDLLETNAAVDRRGMLRVAARFGVAFGAIQLIGCSGAAASITDSTGGTDTTGTSGTASGSAACPTKIPEETAGPYPGDSSNGPNVLNQTGVVRQDIRSSFAGLSGAVTGVLLNLELTIVSASSCTPLSDYAVYLWHCDSAGNYSLYSSSVTNQNYLRGVQAADASGKVKFTSIYPGCYSGRWPHIHFEVYKSLSAATFVSNKIATSQIAMPLAANNLVYATSGYTSSAANQARITLASDNVFSDGASLELATVTGDVNNGMTAALTVAI